MSEYMQALFANMASESTLELVGDVQQLRKFVDYATTHPIRDVREWLHLQVSVNDETHEDMNDEHHD